MDHESPDAARSFAARFFGVPGDAVETVGEDYEEEVWATPRFTPGGPGHDAAAILDRCVLAVDDEEDPDAAVLVIGHVDRDEVDGLLWDPMPGGSGLLDRLCERLISST